VKIGTAIQFPPRQIFVAGIAACDNIADLQQQYKRSMLLGQFQLGLKRPLPVKEKFVSSGKQLGQTEFTMWVKSNKALEEA